MKKKFNNLSVLDLESVVDSIPGSLWVLNSEYQFILGNQQFNENYKQGFGHYPILKQSLLENIGNKEFDEWKGFYDRVLNGEHFNLERSRRYGKPNSWYQYYFSPIQLGEEHSPGAIVQAYDITDKKEAQRNLLESSSRIKENEEKYKTLFLNMSQGAFYQNADGTLVDCNPALLEQFGISKDQFLGRTSMNPQWKVFNEDGRKLEGDDHPSMVALRTGKTVINKVLSVYNPTKEKLVWLSLNAVPQFKKGELKPYQVFVTSHDLTDRKTLESELKNSKSFLEIVYQNSDIGIFVIEVRDENQFFIEGINPVHEKLLGITNEEVKGRSINELEDLLGIEGVKHAKSLYENCLKSKKTIESEFFVPDGHGKGWWYSKISPLTDPNSGKIAKLIGSGLVITERKKIEKELQNSYQSLKKLREISTLEETDFKTISDHILSNITDLTNARYGFYGIINEDESVMRIFSWSGNAMQDCEIHNKPKDYLIDEAGIWGEAIRRRSPLIINNYAHEHPGKKGLPEGHVNLTNLLVVPHFEEDQITSVVAIANRDLSFTDRDIKNVQLFLKNIQAIVKQRLSENLIRESEAKLREQEMVMSNILEDTLSGFWDWNIPSNTEFLSPTFKKMFGYEDHELPNVPESWQKIIFQEDLPGVFECFERHIKSHGREPFYNEVRYRHKNGSTIWVICAGRVIEWNEDGSPIRMVGCHVDITSRKKSEEALKKSEDRYRNLIENIPDYVMVYNRQHQHVYASMKAIQDSGKGIDEYIGKSHREMGFPEHLCSMWENAIDLAFKTGSIETREFEWKSEKGILYLEWRAIPEISTDGSVINVLGLSRDVTEQKKTELEKQNLENQLQQSRKMETIGTLAGGIAHDFNNILTPILGFSDMAIKTLPVDNPLIEDLHSIRSASIRGKDLIDQILTFSRQIKREKQPLRIQTIVKEVIKLIRATIPTSISIDSDISYNCPPVYADPTQIHQVVMNLCVNAVYSMKNQQGELTIKVMPIDLSSKESVNETVLKGGNYICLVVQDTGVGIPSDQLNRIFDPFYSTKSSQRGTGLGLSVVHGIVKDHNGDITVSSQQDVGTVFKVFLPAILSGEENREPENLPIPNGKETILLVDDEEAVLFMAKKMLKRLGYKVIALTNSKNALETFQRDPDSFDLVLTDLTMPDLTGLDFSREVSKISPEIPIVMMTGYRHEISDSILKQAGISGLINKPIVISDLGHAIRKYLDLRLS